MAHKIAVPDPPEDMHVGIGIRLFAEVMTVVFDIKDWLAMYYNDIFKERDWGVGRRKARGHTDYGQYNSKYGLGHERIDIDIPKLRLVLKNLRDLYQIRARDVEAKYFPAIGKMLRSLNDDNFDRRAKALDKVMQLAGEHLSPHEAMLCAGICEFFVNHPLIMSQVIPRVAQMERERLGGNSGS